jgi:hypothetical protein
MSHSAQALSSLWRHFPKDDVERQLFVERPVSHDRLPDPDGKALTERQVI